MRTKTQNGYIPEGGVWTAEERRHIGPHRKMLKTGEIPRAANTVAALCAALEDSHRDDTRYHYPDGGQIPTGCPIHALLDAVKR